MSNDPAIKRSSFFGSNSIILLSLSLTAVLLSSLISTPRAGTISAQPWKVELFAAIFLVPFIYWVYRKHSQQLSFREAPLFPLLVCMAAFIFWSGLSIIWSSSPGSALHHTLNWSIYLTIFAGFLCLLRSGQGLSSIVNTFIVCTLVLASLCIIDFLSMTDFASVEGLIRIRYAKYAELSVTITPLLCVLTLYARTRIRSALAAICWLLSWLTIMLSLSKGAFLAGIIAHTVLFAGCILFTNKILRRKSLVLATVWVVATIAVQLAFSSLSSIPSTTDYISGSADKTRSTTIFRTYIWSVGREMAADHWLIGVGADNFGINVNSARADLAQKNTGNTKPEIAEDYIVERAHNEVLQVSAELGIIGLFLFAGIFGAFLYFAVTTFKRNGYKATPIFWASIAGMTGFIASSMVSSFSFRVIQNGIVFFMVLAVAVNEIIKSRHEQKTGFNSSNVKLLAVSGIIVAVITVLFSGSKAVAEYKIYQAERTQEFAPVAELYRSALRFDPDNAGAYYYFAHRNSLDGNNVEAAQLLRQGIDRGYGVTVTYSTLAKYQILSGDIAGAENTLNEAVKIFPNSVFLRVRFAIFLEKHGKPSDAETNLNTARSIDVRQAAGWEILIHQGSVAAYLKAQGDPNTAPPAELLPENAVFEYLDKVPFS